MPLVVMFSATIAQRCHTARGRLTVFEEVSSPVVMVRFVSRARVYPNADSRCVGTKHTLRGNAETRTELALISRGACQQVRRELDRATDSSILASRREASCY